MAYYQHGRFGSVLKLGERLTRARRSPGGRLASFRLRRQEAVTPREKARAVAPLGRTQAERIANRLIEQNAAGGGDRTFERRRADKTDWDGIDERGEVRRIHLGKAFGRGRDGLELGMDVRARRRYFISR